MTPGEGLLIPVELCGPHVAISSAMLRSSNGSRLWDAAQPHLEHARPLVPAADKANVLEPPGERTLTLWSAVDRTLPSPLPCYDPLTANALEPPDAVAERRRGGGAGEALPRHVLCRLAHAGTR